jgi:cation diffusion facilitator CzcD-associated flavoprotein CzcO
MYTLGYEFAPWLAPKSIADGADILRYIQSTADRCGVTPHITFERRVVRAEWSSDAARWRLTIQHGDSDLTSIIECNFLWGNTGYYRYDRGFRPSFAGEESFEGRFIHPQFWPEDYDGRGKNVVVIGSGATAMTVVPALAADAAKVFLLQRSPTYVASRPDVDRGAQWLMRALPARWAYGVIRAKNVVGSTLIYQLSRRRPEAVSGKLRDAVREALPEGFDVDTHFSPRYNPWDQRLCLITNGDLFEQISAGRVEMVTDTIDHIERNEIVLTSGARIPADIIVTATGLELQFLGGMDLVVNGQPVNLADKVAYKGIMVCDVPNLAMTFGYTNASWTLKADLTARYIGRVLRAMRRRKATIVTPRPPRDGISDEPYIALSAGYITRGASQLPKQGLRRPWKLYQNYFLDFWLFRLRRVDDQLTFSSATPEATRHVVAP